MINCFLTFCNAFLRYVPFLSLNANAHVMYYCVQPVGRAVGLLFVQSWLWPLWILPSLFVAVIVVPLICHLFFRQSFCLWCSVTGRVKHINWTLLQHVPSAWTSVFWVFSARRHIPICLARYAIARVSVRLSVTRVDIGGFKAGQEGHGPQDDKSRPFSL